jgi:hypothetical protein
MNEEAWLTTTDPQKMLAFLRGKASDRKLRLFLCACCRLRLWSELLQEARSAVEVCEDYADGQATKKQLKQARLAARKTSGHADKNPGLGYWSVAVYVAWTAARENSDEAVHEAGAYINRQLPTTAAIIRDIFNPFRPVVLDPVWITCNGGTVVKVAQAIYDERRFHDLPVLADALEEAGCHNAEILGHLRGGGEHVRGCWAVDLLLNKP